MLDGKGAKRAGASASPSRDRAEGGCYGVQILVAGRRKRWRDEVSAEIRRAGYCATTVDSAHDALTVLVLGLPVDVLVTDAELQGQIGCSELAMEARALRPNLGIVLAKGECEDALDAVPDALLIAPDARGCVLATTVREALAART